MESLGTLFSHLNLLSQMSNIFIAAWEGDLARVEELVAQGGLDLTTFNSDRLQR